MTTPHTHSVSHLPHQFDDGNPAAERGTQLVLWITLITMVAEIIGGWWFNSMALLADGWHMSSHAVAMGTAWLAYVLARRHAGDASFAWGTWKIEILAGYTSALLLLGVAALMLWSSVERLQAPLPIHYGEAMALAAVGLLVNLVCAVILHRAGHHHDHDHDHGGSDPHVHEDHDHGVHAHAEHGHDVNLRAAFVHVLADALTSALAIAALAGGSLFGWDWLDPLAGIVGAVLVAVWAFGLLKSGAAILLDRDRRNVLPQRIREVLVPHAERCGFRIIDLHVWQVGRVRHACVLHLEVAAADVQADEVRGWLQTVPEVYHASIEISRAA